MSRALTVLAAVAALVAGGCGGGEDPVGANPDTGSMPAAGENTPPAGTPGVPEGAPYDLAGTQWVNLAEDEQTAAADAYVTDNPDRCEGADPEAVAQYAASSFGVNFPLEVPVADVLAEGCDADLQS